MDAKTDDSAGKCPFTGGTRGHSEPRLVAGASRYRRAPSQRARRRSDGRGVRLRQGIREPRPRRRDQGPACLDDGLAGVVAGRLRSLRRAVHPPGVAQRRHLSHHRRPRRRRRRPAALRAAQLAGRTTPTSTRRAACCGRSSRSTAARSPGPTCWFSPATSRSNRWASRPSASPAAAPTCGSRKNSTGVPKAPGSATNATAASASSPSRSARCRWA